MIASFLITDLASWQPCIDLILPHLTSGRILALVGPLGAGKTTFTQLLLRELGVQTAVKSPTFALLRSYALTTPNLTRALHVDAYRLEREEDAQVLNLDEELAEPGTIAIIEWPERLPYWLTAHAEQVICLTIHPESDGSRTVSVEWQA